MDRSTKIDNARKTENWRENNCERKSLKGVATNTDTNSQEAVGSNQVFGNITFTVVDAPDKVQACSALVTTGTSIPEYPTIKGICDDSGAQIQVSSSAKHSTMYIINIEIPKSQVAILAKNGATFVVQGGNSYSINSMMLSNRKYCENINYGASNNNFNWQINRP